MDRSPYALLVLFATLASAAPAQTTLAPQAGILVLRNGHVLDGDVLRAGDYYVVTKGEGSEVRPKAEDVECFCRSLAEAYDYKAARLSGSGARPHLELAKWCLRLGLYEQCSEQLTAATRAEPGHPQIKELETRLELALETPPPAAAPVPSSGAVSTDELERRIRALPKGSVERFGAVVQPILLNRCGANRCHGPNSESSFRLLRPPPGQVANRRFTQRNLYETLKQLDPADPDASPLVVMPQRRHGNSLVAVFDKQSQQQLAELVAWARLATAAAPAASSVTSSVPASIIPAAATLSQPAAATSPAAAAPAAEVATELPAQRAGVRVLRPALDGAAAGPSTSPHRPPPPRDPYDAEIFNRHYHGN